jgi:hypothetical protein
LKWWEENASPATCQLIRDGIQPPWKYPPKISTHPKTRGGMDLHQAEKILLDYEKSGSVKKVWDNETMKQLYLHQNKIQYKDNRIDRIESLARKKQEKMSIAYVKENQVALKIGVPIQYLHPIKTEYYEMFYENTYIDAVLELERTYGIELFKVNDENRIENNDRPQPF